jgi:hypothetical protein
MRVARIGALAVLGHHEHVVDAPEVLRVQAGFGANHERAVAGLVDRHASTLEHRPETAEVARVGIVGLVAVHDQGVEAFLAQEDGRSLTALLVLVVRDADPCHRLPSVITMPSPSNPPAGH